MRFKSLLSILPISAIAASLPVASAQTPAVQAPASQAAAKSPALPAFEVATIKPIDPNGGGAVGFYSRPGGRVFLGYAPVKMILYYAFNVQEYQISGGPAWIGTDRFNIEAVPPDTAASRTAKQPPIGATPSDEQRKMLQSLLIDRFRLQYHREVQQGAVYILSLGKNKLQLQEPKDKDADARGGVMIKQGGIADGEAFGTNVTMTFLAGQLSRYLGLPVLDQTGLTGSYDYHLPPTDPDNHDMAAAALDAMHRLGLELKKGKGPVETLVIDHIERPTEN